MEEDGLDNLINELKGIPYKIEDAVFTTMTQVARDVQAVLKQDARVDTRRWKDGISVRATRNSLRIGMVEYGYFQIFGVKGKKGGRAIFAVEPEGLNIVLPPKNGTTYSFGTDNNHPGINGLRVSANLLANITEQIITTFQKQDVL